MYSNRFKFGIEHEVAFVNAKGEFADFSNTPFEDLERIIRELPVFREDTDQLRTGDAGIKVKRWYVEGFERFDLRGNVLDCPPKGIEIRTTIHDSIKGVIKELETSMGLLRKTASIYGFSPVLVSFNPVRSKFDPVPPLNSFEKKQRCESPESLTAEIPILTYGPDLNISNQMFSNEQNIDVAQKLTYCSPFIIPFTYSSPIVNGELTDYLSYRTYLRTGARPAVMVFTDNSQYHHETNPSLTQLARIPAENGRIEFKAFDSCSDFSLYASLLVLLKGLALDNTLQERLTTPDKLLHQRSALKGFRDPEIYKKAKHLLRLACDALRNDPDLILLEQLNQLLASRKSASDSIRRLFKQKDSLSDVLTSVKY